ncbi:MBL fold metallo-hydrolase [Streptomyces sp. NPDC052040]|uniref:MBL fold metallo-hydrolase n=1 Tax=unclassified Streptomyces TaxID=2593676 RepID=UPI0037D6321A
MDQDPAVALTAGDTGLRLTVLGAGAPYPVPERACSGYLVRGGRAAVWVDTGPGTLAPLQRFAELETLSAVWISHLHADHAADLLGAYYALGLCGVTRNAPLPVYAPRGCAERLAGYFAEPGTAFLDRAFRFHELADGREDDVDGIRLVSKAVEHDLEAFGLRVEHGGSILAYTGDSAPCPALDELGAGADLLLSEAGDGRCAPEGTRRHLTPEEAGQLARRSGARSLLLTHLAPGLATEDALRRAESGFDGPVDCAREGRTYQVPAVPTAPAPHGNAPDERIALPAHGAPTCPDAGMRAPSNGRNE